MENKYYTPTIEEFHPGFIYEITKYPDAPLYTTNTTINLLFEHDEYINELRVKHLDKSDIEILGWEFENEYVAYYKHKLYVHEFWGPPESRTEHKERYKLFFRKGEITISNDQTYDDYQSLFKGAIKNKQELIKLMQQLNIK